ncbi:MULTISPECIES: GAF domain-containing sensor histidine kinase [unclassified Sulfitobacter]|uniref:GAF domain-containing sensor histidine kinase n=1 Tax=Sulfitobacter TaxID=60136 RepID=UPI0004E2D979|nr:MULTISPECIES: GAF domain-containing sensor histidine kinase [unclassified Sulfitobacter]PTA99558.1 histidine kinase [Sulfitobacter sp. CB-A]ULO21291.1 GAF domain-containing sensor histidine kinase [Sulfitobacter sp. CB2047]
MDDKTNMRAIIQDHEAYLAGAHDFQSDIEMLAASETVGTLLETVMLATDMRFAAVARVTTDRWVACRTVDEVNFGLSEGDEIGIDQTFCQSVRETSEKVMFNDVATDDVYRNHPIAAQFGIVSYASIPIFRSNGSFFGTLCAIDTEPRDVKHPRVVAMLEMFADIIGRSLETEERLEAQERLVEHERQMAAVQEEFVAVLGHDLRNSVAALNAGVRQLDKEPLSDKARKILPLMGTSIHRMSELIDNIMLHAKSRLGGGIRISATPDAGLEDALNHVVEEVRAAAPDHKITVDLDFDRPVSCDAARVAQAVSNLLSNAVRYADDGSEVTVRGRVSGAEAVISVANRGAPIPESLKQKLFQPYQRGDQTKGEGLGLGLHIASSIAVAHSGQIDVTCDDGLTTFAFRLPLLAA